MTQNRDMRSRVTTNENLTEAVFFSSDTRRLRFADNVLATLNLSVHGVFFPQSEGTTLCIGEAREPSPVSRKPAQSNWSEQDRRERKQAAERPLIWQFGREAGIRDGVRMPSMFTLEIPEDRRDVIWGEERLTQCCESLPGRLLRVTGLPGEK